MGIIVRRLSMMHDDQIANNAPYSLLPIPYSLFSAPYSYLSASIGYSLAAFNAG